jgi:hypothetical protein
MDMSSTALTKNKNPNWMIGFYSTDKDIRNSRRSSGQSAIPRLEQMDT